MVWNETSEGEGNEAGLVTEETEEMEANDDDDDDKEEEDEKEEEEEEEEEEDDDDDEEGFRASKQKITISSLSDCVNTFGCLHIFSRRVTAA